MNPTVLVVEDDAAFRAAVCDTLEMTGFSTVAAPHGEAALTHARNQDLRLVISDVQMERMDGMSLLGRLKSVRPDLPVLLMTAYGNVQQAVDAMRDGAVDYLLKPFEAEVLAGKVGRYLAADLDTSDGAIAVDSRMRETLAMARRVAQTDVTALLTGESGSGKEVVAQYIHRHSSRAGAPFVAINCAAIPDNMLEAILFGYEKGAFTGAYKACPGKFEQAQDGTLLLDEVSEMDIGLQAKLLRVLQEQEVERLGGHQALALDIRVLATSNQDMRAEVQAGRFREDLYYRLNVFPIHIPALRERPCDIVPLAEHLAARAAQKIGRAAPRLSEAAAECLLAHDWPGNVRELDNVVQRALVLQSGEVIEPDDLRMEGEATRPASGSLALGSAPAFASAGGEMPAAGADSLGDDLWAAERELILKALATGNGSRRRAAEQLGISPRTLRYRLARMRAEGISVPNGR